MPIRNDPLNRWWVDVSSVNPAIVNALRPSLVAFLAFDHGRMPSIAGTGFVIAGMPDFALVISAKHVLSEGVLKIQRPVPAYSASALFVPPSLRTPSLNPERLKAIWMGAEYAGLLNAVHACYNNTLDIACLLITPQELYATPFRPVSIALDTTVPSIGDIVHMVSLEGMDVSELAPPTGANGTGHKLSITRRISIRIGTVTDTYAQGFRQYRWPCFTTSIPAEPGMSGGFVHLPRDGATIAACGVVCADNSTVGARADYFQCGESVIACGWPALALRVPISIPSTPDSPTRTLYDMMRDGSMNTAVGGIDHIEVVDLGNGECRIGYRSA